MLYIQQTCVIVFFMSEGRTKNLDSVDPGICIGSRIKMLSRTAENVYRKHLKPYNLTSSQLSILFFVGKKKEVDQKDVGRFLLLERSTVSRDLTRLVENGLILKKGSESRPILVITKKGSARLEEIIPAWKIAHEETTKLLGEDVTTNIDDLVKRFRN